MSREKIKTLLSEALQKHRNGELIAAESFYRKAILADPSDPQSKHYLGFLLQQTDRLAEAVEQFKAAIAIDDAHAECHFNLGIALFRQGQVTDAIAAFENAIALNPDKYFYWTNLGASFELNQELVRAEQCYKVASKIDPFCADAFHQLSVLYLKQERFPEARHNNYRRIIAAPAGSNSPILLAQAYYELGRKEDAVALLERWVLAEPGNSIAAHLLAAYRGTQPPDRCASQYVELTFDSFANNFEDTLSRLKYRGPQLVHDYLATLGFPPASLDVLDLGCGTGLIGEVLRPFARMLVGVDLSQAMLDQAVAKKIYDRLHKAEISNHLLVPGEPYDLISCMDTFVYLGRLVEIMQRVFRLADAA